MISFSIGGVYYNNICGRFFQVVDCSSDFQSEEEKYVIITYPTESYKWARFFVNDFIIENIDSLSDDKIANQLFKTLRKINNKFLITIKNELYDKLYNSSILTDEYKFLDLYDGRDKSFSVRRSTITRDIISIETYKSYDFIPKTGIENNKRKFDLHRISIVANPSIIHFIKHTAVKIDDILAELIL